MRAAVGCQPYNGTDDKHKHSDATQPCQFRQRPKGNADCAAAKQQHRDFCICAVELFHMDEQTQSFGYDAKNTRIMFLIFTSLLFYVRYFRSCINSFICPFTAFVNDGVCFTDINLCRTKTAPALKAQTVSYQTAIHYSLFPISWNNRQRRLFHRHHPILPDAHRHAGFDIVEEFLAEGIHRGHGRVAPDIGQNRARRRERVDGF